MRASRCSAAALSSIVLLSALVGIVIVMPVERSANAQEAAPVRPGPEHAPLARLAGTWNAVAHFRALPDQPMQSSKARETRRMGCDGFWLICDYEGELLGQRFEGHSTVGYDQVQKKYTGIWADSMSSSLSVISGRFEESTRTFTYENTTFDPGTGQPFVFTVKDVIEDDDHHVTSIFMKGPDGKDFESLRIEYTREGAPPRKRADPLAEIVGTWKMQVTYQEDGDPLDYDLRITKAGDGLAAVLVSPRSGEHKYKSAEWKNGTLHLAIMRSYDGNEMELKYEAKLSEKGLAGKVTLVGLDGLSGTWTATRKN